MSSIIEQLEQEEIKRLNKTIPVFAPGDTVIVNVNVVEGERRRIQAFEGVVIGRRNRALAPPSSSVKCPRVKASSAPSSCTRR